MKKITAVVLAVVLALTLAACGSGSAPASDKDYAAIIQSTRSDDMNSAYHIVADGTVAYSPKDMEMDEQQAADYLDTAWQLTGLDPTLMDKYAISVSLMNIRVYCAIIVKPAEGQTQAVLDNLQAYATNIQKSFESYLPDQYEIAKKAELRTAKSGEVILVMEENAASVADAIEKELAA